MRQLLLRRVRASTLLSGGSRPRYSNYINHQRCPLSISLSALLPIQVRVHHYTTQRTTSSSSSSSSSAATTTTQPPEDGDPLESPEPPQPPPVQLRQYQAECIQAVVDSFKKGDKRVGISLATGGGKTVIFTQLLQHVEPPRKGATQTLILAHRRELVEQAARHCMNTYPDATVEIDMAGAHASGLADITIASVPSLTRDVRLEKYDPNRFKLVLVDEAHHIVAPGYLKILDHFGLGTKQEGSPYLVGVSATLSRFDGLKLGVAIDEIVYHKDYVDMIDEKWLSSVIFTTVQSTADISAVRKAPGAGDFVTSDLSNAVNTDQVNTVTVRSWLAKASGRKSTLVFCVDLKHVTGLTRKFRQHGVDARFITGETDKLERGAMLDAFKRGDFPVLLNCGVFTEGTDIPNIDCIVLARPTRSRNLLIQMIGRGMRLHKNKKDCHVIDMVASLETGIVTVPTLFGLDPSELVTESTAGDMKSIKERKEDEEYRKFQAYEDEIGVGDIGRMLSSAPQTQVTFTEYESVQDLIADTSAEKHINRLSPYAWVCISPIKYILSDKDGSYLRLQKEQPAGMDTTVWCVWYLQKLAVGKAPYMAPRMILSAEEFFDAVHGADKFAQHRFVQYIIRRNAPWRNASASDSQVKFLNKMRSKDDELTVDDVTKGQATNMINKIKFGAQGAFRKYQVQKRKHEQQMNQQEQERQRKLSEMVSVGPLNA